jgi:hypothetical protein
MLNNARLADALSRHGYQVGVAPIGDAEASEDRYFFLRDGRVVAVVGAGMNVCAANDSLVQDLALRYGVPLWEGNVPQALPRSVENATGSAVIRVFVTPILILLVGLAGAAFWGFLSYIRER